MHQRDQHEHHQPKWIHDTFAPDGCWMKRDAPLEQPCNAQSDDDAHDDTDV